MLTKRMDTNIKDELQNFMDRKTCVRVFTIVAGIFQDRMNSDDANFNTCWD